MRVTCRLGDPFGVACESIEAIHVIDGKRLLLGCDNNFPNTGRNANLADDNELIVVRVPGLKSLDSLTALWSVSAQRSMGSRGRTDHGRTNV